MQIKKVLGKITSQSNILGRWWGDLQTIAANTNIYIQFIILCFSGTSAYAVLSSTLHQWGYQLPFWQFVLCVFFLLCLVALFAWKLSIPSTFTTWNYLWWHNGNYAKEKIEKMEQELAEIKKLLQEIRDEQKVR